MTAWQVESADVPPDLSARTSDVPLKWAHDERTGEPRYIHDSEVINRKCSCTCPACQLKLTPVMAGQPLHLLPTAHFRHPPGSQKKACTLVAARLAATHLLQVSGFIELPRRAMSRTATGFSGKGYEVWVEEPAERIAVRGSRLLDRVTAELTLDDGRKLLVDLTGQRQPCSEFDGQAVVTISLSDRQLATLTIEEIRSRLRILPDICWCAHWNDRALASKGDAAASQAACDALDMWTAEDEAEFRVRLLPGTDKETAQNLRRETLLHREAKAILEREQRIATPGLDVIVTREPPEEFLGEWELDTLRVAWLTVQRTLELCDVRLERRLGRIVPDVVANLSGRQIYMEGFTSTAVNGVFEEEIHDSYPLPWPPTLLVEITVTHGIDEAKHLRIRELNLPTLEIDLSMLGGHITLDNLRDLIVDQVVGKRWVHHPVFAIKQQKLNEALDKHRVTLGYQERLIELRRPQWLAMPASHWAHRYLVAVTAFHEADVLIKRAEKQHQGDGEKLQLVGARSDARVGLSEAAEALSAHGLPGGADPIMFGESGLIARLLSIQQNRGIGYDVKSGYDVLNAIMQSGRDKKRWDTLYAIAVKAYGLEGHFTAAQARTYREWREALIAKVNANDKAYMRPAIYDPVLSELFPEMAHQINKGYGRLPDLG